MNTEPYDQEAPVRIAGAVSTWRWDVPVVELLATTFRVTVTPIGGTFLRKRYLISGEAWNMTVFFAYILELGIQLKNESFDF